ncbi:MAG: hypothetical protein MZW92_76735 [Comamonadaceae bacterium]|nr:hypothetical protein [Comamonadaceae bacterium]
MATIAGTVLVLYASILGPVVPGALAPPADRLARRARPPPSSSPRSWCRARAGSDDGLVELTAQDRSAMDAITRGTLEGLELLLNIVAMLVVFVALVSLCQRAARPAACMWAGTPLTLERMLGWVFAPLAWACRRALERGPGRRRAARQEDRAERAHRLSRHGEAARRSDLSPRSKLLMTYALCGFANFGSLGIMLGGMGAMVPPSGAANWWNWA